MEGHNFRFPLPHIQDNDEKHFDYQATDKY